MDQGYSIVVFPEGRRASDQNIQPFMSGSGLLWSDLRCPALPVYLGGLGRLKQTGEHWLHSGKMSIRIGELMPARPDLEAERAAALLEQALRALAESAGASRPAEFRLTWQLPRGGGVFPAMHRTSARHPRQLRDWRK
jgi:long-chain acyl-CoA synthetase